MLTKCSYKGIRPTLKSGVITPSLEETFNRSWLENSSYGHIRIPIGWSLLSLEPTHYHSTTTTSIFGMPISFDAPTPQLKVTKTLLESYITRDLSKVEPLLSKDFKFRSFPEVDHHPEETKAKHIENWGPRFSSFSKVDVRIQQRRITSELID